LVCHVHLKPTARIDIPARGQIPRSVLNLVSRL
jgi:hypothetical protein